MKKYIFLLFVLTSFLAQSQFGGMRNQRQRQMMPQTPQQAPDPEFKVDRYLGIVVYDDIKKAAKKSSIKLSSEEGKEFSKLLTNYNKKVKDIRRINSFTLQSTKEMVESFQKTAMKTGDVSNQVAIQKKMVENLKPIAEALKVEDLELVKNLKALLSEKQYDKWIKYNRKQGKFFPKQKVEE